MIREAIDMAIEIVTNSDENSNKYENDYDNEVMDASEDIAFLIADRLNIELDTDEAPGWLVSAVQEVAERYDREESELERQSWVEDLCERAAEEAA